ncbi:MAG: cytochrome c [bacterium]|nr:cytochrome c [bacterium]
MMPRWVVPSLVLLATLALVPPALVVKARVHRSAQPRVHIVQDMDNQERFKPQQANAMFVDGRAMRRPVAGTVARGQLATDSHLHRGLVGEGYAEAFPMELSSELLHRGRERYEIYCAPCHGMTGRGDGTVARRADELQQGTWVPPASIHDEPASTREVGHLFNTITNGIRTMPAYGSQLAVEDRWAVVAYLKALQRSRRASPADVPADARGELR